MLTLRTVRANREIMGRAQPRPNVREPSQLYHRNCRDSSCYLWENLLVPAEVDWCENCKKWWLDAKSVRIFDGLMWWWYLHKLLAEIQKSFSCRSDGWHIAWISVEFQMTDQAQLLCQLANFKPHVTIVDSEIIVGTTQEWWREKCARKLNSWSTKLREGSFIEAVVFMRNFL